MAADNFLWFTKEATGGSLKGTNAKKPEGETTDAYFSGKKALEIQEFSFGIEQADTTVSGSTGSGAGKAKFLEFSVKKAVDLSSAPLFNACAAGAHFPEVYLAVRKAGGDPMIYLQYVFRQVFVIGVNWSGGSGEEAPSEEIKFKYGAMAFQYVQQKPNGQQGSLMQSMWSVVENNATCNTSDQTGAPTFLEPIPK